MSRGLLALAIATGLAVSLPGASASPRTSQARERRPGERPRWTLRVGRRPAAGSELAATRLIDGDDGAEPPTTNLAVLSCLGRVKERVDVPLPRATERAMVQKLGGRTALVERALAARFDEADAIVASTDPGGRGFRLIPVGDPATTGLTNLRRYADAPGLLRTATELSDVADAVESARGRLHLATVKLDLLDRQLDDARWLGRLTGRPLDLPSAARIAALRDHITARRAELIAQTSALLVAQLGRLEPAARTSVRTGPHRSDALRALERAHGALSRSAR